MNGLMIYASYYGNTKQVAQAIGEESEKAGHKATVQDVKRKLPNLDAVDFIFVGAPTRIGRAPGRARRILRALRKRGYRRPVVIFDTCGEMPKDADQRTRSLMEPGAAGKMHERAKMLGLNVYPKDLRCVVTGLKGPLGPQELEKAKTFTREYLASGFREAR